MKLKSEILKDKNGKTISIEEFAYNDIDKIVRQDYKDENGNRKFYKTFEYDENGNCIKTKKKTGLNFTGNSNCSSGQPSVFIV